MRGFLFLGLAAVAGCASSGTPKTAPGAANTGMARVSGDAVSTGAVPIAGASTVVGAIDRLWAALPAVYDSVGIPIATIDGAARLIGNRGLQLRRQLGGASLSKYIDCGYAQGRPSADFYDVNLSVTTQLQPEDSLSTKIITTVDAVGRPVLFTGEYNHCGTKGVLESRIASLLEAAARQ